MRMLKKLSALLIGAACAVALAAGVAVADPYQYTITLYSGDAADFASGDAKTFTCQKGQVITLDASDVVMPEGSVYYPKGVRLAGQNSDESQPSLAITVEEDADYVVAYGLKKSQVSYTVNIKNSEGQVLASVTHTGNVGDHPVMAYVYVPNYLPHAWTYRLPKLGEGSNVFDVVYSPVPSGAQTVVVSDAAVPGGVVPDVPGVNPNTTTGVLPINVVAHTGETVTDPSGNPLVSHIPDEVEIDENGVPLAPEPPAPAGRNFPWVAVVAAAVVVLVSLVFALTWGRRKTNK